MSKEYWPTQKYIEKLRENGIFPYSHSATIFLNLGCLFVIFYFLQENTDYYVKCFSSFFSNDIQVSKFSKISSLFIAIPAFIFFISSFAILLQSKFLINTKNFVSNIFAKKVERDFGILNIFLTIIVFLFCLLLYVVTIYILLGEAGSLLNNSTKDIIFLLNNNIGNFLLVFVFIFFLLFLFCFSMGKGRFLIKYRMTKEQYELEQREKE